MYCWKCGTKNEEQASSCTSCQSALLGHLAKAIDQTEGKSGFFSTKSEIRFHKSSDGAMEIVVEDDTGRKVYHKIEDAPPLIQKMLQRMEGKKDGSQNFDFDFGLGLSGGFKNLSDFTNGEIKVIEGESSPSSSKDVTFSSKKKLGLRPSVEMKSDVPWTLILGAIVVAIVLYWYVTFGV